VSALTLAAPELAWSGAAPQIEQPVELKLPAILFPDGVEATEADAQKVGAFVYRQGSGGEEIWNETEQAWTPPPEALGALPPVALSYKAGDPFPWQGTLVAIGMKDKDGQDRFAKAAGGAPSYRLRAYASFRRDGAELSGLSPASDTLEFVSGAESQLFKVKMDPDDPQQTQEVTVLLKNAAQAAAGYLKISTKSGQEVEIANCDASGTPLAVVRLAADGSINLQPATGKKVVIAGDLEAKQIRYLSSDGVTTKDLA
jgi:hypothetical protein